MHCTFTLDRHLTCTALDLRIFAADTLDKIFDVISTLVFFFFTFLKSEDLARCSPTFSETKPRGVRLNAYTESSKWPAACGVEPRLRALQQVSFARVFRVSACISCRLASGARL